jgi:hypothetical protein
MLRFPTLHLLGLAFAVLTACTRPIDADFEGNDPGLKDEELFWVQRVPSQVSVLPWKPVMTSADSIDILTFNLPVFEQVMPLLIRDLMEGSLRGPRILGRGKTHH